MKTKLEGLLVPIINTLDDPTLLVQSGKIVCANEPARQLLGNIRENSDVRLTIRHPQALGLILPGLAGRIELVGLGDANRAVTLVVSPLNKNALLVRIIDRSAIIAAERMRTDFVANASHELRTPLANIIGYAETLGEDSPIDDDTRRRFGSTVETEARRMLRIVEDLMSLSRIEADRYRPPDEVVDMGEVARLAIEHSTNLAERRGCRVDAQIGDGIPKLKGDFSQLLQLADNLIGNAIRYGCNDRSQAISVTVALDGQRIRFTVKDEGDGIAPEHLPRLTERFYRVSSARSRESGGTGLGLAIVKHVVERHRGELSIDSAPGKGTVVTVSLPID